MEARYYVSCLWPGLAELWWRGRLSALPAAIAFTCALNLLLVTRFIYPQWMASGLVTMACWIGVFAWIFYVVRSIRDLPSLVAPRSVSEKPDRFGEAQAAFLNGQWAEAEGLLADVLAIEPRDPPALLMLVSVYRHTERLEAAHTLLQEIVKLEIADTWFLEVEAEALRLKKAIQAANNGAGEAAKNRAGEGETPDSSADAGAADLTERSRRAA